MAWPGTRLTELLEIQRPIVLAPMAGGPATVELAVAVSQAGGLGSLAGALLAPDELRASIRALRAATPRPFAVNLFAPLPPAEVNDVVVEDVRRSLDAIRTRLGMPEPQPSQPPAWSIEDQLAVAIDEHVPALSFTFGIPPLGGLDDLALMGTATTVEEARALERAGVHVVVAQSSEAGGHRGTFIGSFDEGLVPLDELVPAVRAAVSIPVIASGGLMHGDEIAAAMRLGADGVQLGTAFLFSSESGASEAWRRALRDYPTFVTDTYTGRPARGARTPFLAELAAGPPPAPYAIQRGLTGDFRALKSCGWYLGGEGASRARDLPAGELVELLVAETEHALRGQP